MKTSVSRSIAAMAVVLAFAVAGAFADQDRKGPLWSGGLESEISQAAGTIRSDAKLSEEATAFMYSAMVGRLTNQMFLQVFLQARATPLIRQALMTQNLNMVADAAVYLQKNGTVSDLPELVYALERENYHWTLGVGEGNTAHAVVQQDLVKAIVSVTGLGDAALKVLPARPFSEMNEKDLAAFVSEVRKWAESRGIALYPPAEPLPPKPRPTVESEVDLIIHDAKTTADERDRQLDRARLMRLRDKINAGLEASHLPADDQKK